MKRLERILLYAFLVLLPFNIKKFIANPLNTQPLNEFSAIFLYLSDVLILALLTLWLIKSIRAGKLKLKKIPVWSIFLTSFIALSTLTLFWSEILTLNLYFLIKLFLAVGLFLYLGQNLKKKILVPSLQIISLGGILQSLIALGQFARQSSLGLRYLGESVTSSGLAGIAKIDIGSIKMIRSYGTFSHPNILGTFLLLALYCSIHLALKKKRVFLFTIPFLVLGLILTFSRTILLLGSASIIFYLTYFFFKKKDKHILRPLLVFVVSLVVLALPLLPLLSQRANVTHQDQAVSLRVFYNKAAVEIIKKSPLMGVGLGNFTTELKSGYPDLENWQYQPVHNIYLLITSEVGIFGLLTFIFFLIFFAKQYLVSNVQKPETSAFFVLFIAFLLIGALDHYFFTINQGILLFWLTLGLVGVSMVPVPKEE